MRLGNHRGDTIIEVILSTVVLAVVLSGAYSLTNRATRGNQNAYERSEVAAQMAEQAELIELARQDASGTRWQSLSAYFAKNLSPDYSACEVSGAAQPFYLDPSTATPTSFVAGPSTQDAYDDLFKVWVEAYENTSERYVDFHIRACWEGIGSLGEQRSVIIKRISL